MINLKQIFDDIYIIIAKKQSLFEFILNLTFVLIIFLLLTILYWDNINRSIINNGRCKIAINNSDLTYNLKVYNKEKNNTNIFDISYDGTKEHNVKIDCSCPVGNKPNQFSIPIHNQKDNIDYKVEKICYCDDDYKDGLYNDFGSLDINKIDMDGDSFLEDYYKNFYDNYGIKSIKFSPIDFPK